MIAKAPAPAYCHGCGQPYPWTLQAREELRRLTEEIPDLTGEERAELSDAIDDVIDQSPIRKERSLEKVKQSFLAVSAVLWDQAKDILARIAVHGLEG